MMYHCFAKQCGWQENDWAASMAQVGPESAGAHPGPVCYRKGGHAAITDANLVLGRILPQFFPNIFGPNGDPPLLHPAPHRDTVEELLAHQGASQCCVTVGQDSMTCKLCLCRG